MAMFASGQWTVGCPRRKAAGKTAPSKRVKRQRSLPRFTRRLPTPNGGTESFCKLPYDDYNNSVHCFFYDIDIRRYVS